MKVSVSGNDSVSAAATAEKDPGLYSVSLTFPREGHFDVLFDITSSDKSDIIEVKGIEVGTGGVEPSGTAKSHTWVIVLVGSVVVLLVLTLLFFRRRKHTSHVASTIGAMFLVLSLTSPPSYAHGGEDDEGRRCGSYYRYTGVHVKGFPIPVRSQNGVSQEPDGN